METFFKIYFWHAWICLLCVYSFSFLFKVWYSDDETKRLLDVMCPRLSFLLEPSKYFPAPSSAARKLSVLGMPVSMHPSSWNLDGGHTRIEKQGAFSIFGAFVAVVFSLLPLPMCASVFTPNHLACCPPQTSPAAQWLVRGRIKIWIVNMYLHKMIVFFFFCVPSYISGIHHSWWDFSLTINWINFSAYKIMLPE